MNMPFRMAGLSLTIVAAAVSVHASAQTTAAPSGTKINPYNAVIGTTAGTLAGGDALAGEISQRQALAGRTVDLNGLGVPTTTSGTDAAVSGTALATISSTFTPADVGKNILIRGAGAAGISFQTTIAGYVGPHAVTLASPAATPVSGVTFWWGADASAGVSAAYARASSQGLAVKGRGTFWLASQTTPILLSNTSTTPDGGPTQSFSPYTGSGLVFMVTSTTVAPFSPGVGAHFGAAMFWPAQDGSAVSPIVYPAAFDLPAGALVTNFTVSGAFFVNPYRLLSMEPTSGGGRIFVTNTRAYCIDRCFDVRTGLADTIQIDDTDYFGPGVYDDTADTGNAYLRRYTAANAELFHLDPGDTGSIDGLLIGGAMVQSMRYAIRQVSGLLDVSKVTGLDLDSTPVAYSVEGNARGILSWTGGQIYSSQVFSPAANSAVFHVSTSNELTQLTISGVSIPYAQGSIVQDDAFGLGSLTLTGNTIVGYGKTTSTGGTYYVVAENNNPSTINVAGNIAIASGGTSGNAWSGLLLGNLAAYSVTGNIFENMATPIAVYGVTGAGTVLGNTIVGTYGGKSLVSGISGSAKLIGGATMNNFDKP